MKKIIEAENDECQSENSSNNSELFNANYQPKQSQFCNFYIVDIIFNENLIFI